MPWSSELPKDYEKIITEFGLEPFDPDIFPEPNMHMRRLTVCAGRDLSVIAKAINEKKPFYVLTGIMPSGTKIHFGTKTVIENVKYFQEHGALTYVLVADLEALATRGIPLEEGKKRALEFHIPAYIALGLDINKTMFYFQSKNRTVLQLAFKFSNRITLNEFRAVYGNADPPRIMSALTQVGDIMYPQAKHKMPGIIPVGIDQDPHIRLSRDVARRTKQDGFFLPSALINKFTPSLDGNLKMSKSKPESCIELPEDPKSVCKKLMRALTGGRDTVEEQRAKGGNPDKCIIFELYKQHLIDNDNELMDIYNKCKAGELLCGEDKKYACKKMTGFLEEFNNRLVKAKRMIGNVKFVEE